MSGEIPGEELTRGTGIDEELMPCLGIWQKKNFGIRAGCHWDGHLFMEMVVGKLGFLLVCLLLVGLPPVGLLLATFYTTVDVLC